MVRKARTTKRYIDCRVEPLSFFTETMSAALPYLNCLYAKAVEWRPEKALRAKRQAAAAPQMPAILHTGQKLRQPQMQAVRR